MKNSIIGWSDASTCKVVQVDLHHGAEWHVADPDWGPDPDVHVAWEWEEGGELHIIRGGERFGNHGALVCGDVLCDILRRWPTYEAALAGCRAMIASGELCNKPEVTKNACE